MRKKVEILVRKLQWQILDIEASMARSHSYKANFALDKDRRYLMQKLSKLNRYIKNKD